MKTSCTIAALALLQTVIAQPHRHHAAHHHNKRGVVVEWVTVQAQDVVVHVDENGVPFYTEGGGAPAPTAAPVAVQSKAPAAAPANPSPAPVAPVAPVQPAQPAPPAQPAAAPVDDHAQRPAQVAQPQSPPVVVHPAPPALEAVADEDGPFTPNARYASEAAGINKSNGYGISWTPFDGGEADTTCKTQEQANREFAVIAQQQFTSVRIYGTPCDQVTLAMRAAAANGLTLMLGIFELHDTAGEARRIIEQVERSGVGWGIVHTISVGNEDIEKGTAGPGDIIASVGTARHIFSSTGFQGAFVHVDTMGAILRNPQLCSEAAGDYIAANIHPFFNNRIAARHAGRFVAQQVGALRACSVTQNRKRKNHRVVVTETGWPTGGNNNGLAHPGRLQQWAAIRSIKRHIPNDMYLYSAFNNRWLKDNAGTFNAEHYWGILEG